MFIYIYIYIWLLGVRRDLRYREENVIMFTSEETIVDQDSVISGPGNIAYGADISEWLSPSMWQVYWCPSIQKEYVYLFHMSIPGITLYT